MTAKVPGGSSTLSFRASTCGLFAVLESGLVVPTTCAQTSFATRKPHASFGMSVRVDHTSGGPCQPWHVATTKLNPPSRSGSTTRTSLLQAPRQYCTMSHSFPLDGESSTTQSWFSHVATTTGRCHLLSFVQLSCPHHWSRAIGVPCFVRESIVSYFFTDGQMVLFLPLRCHLTPAVLDIVRQLFNLIGCLRWCLA